MATMGTNCLPFTSIQVLIAGTWYRSTIESLASLAALLLVPVVQWFAAALLATAP